MIIKSLLDTDFYKFTMMQAVLHNYPSAWVRYTFKWRNLDQMRLRIPISDFVGRIKKEIDNLCTLQLTKDELNFVAGCSYFTRDFIEFLRMFKLNRSFIKVWAEKEVLCISIEGPWLHTILYEVPVLAIVSQEYTHNNDRSQIDWLVEGRKRLQNKLSMIDASVHKDQKFLFADFGTRRRADVEFHDEIIETILEHPAGRCFVGTSNMYLAMKYGIKMIGTVAHEWLQAHQQLGSRLIDSQKAALQVWANEYRGELGVALSDVMGFRAFLKDFDRYFGLLFDGCRHDSGDPVWWAETLIAHYKALRIDPKTKSAVFSDGLNFETAIDLFRRFHTQIGTSFGVGTHLTNDCGFIAPQIVIKLVECNGKPTAKVSDSAGKGMCEDPEFDAYLRKIIEEKIAA